MPENNKSNLTEEEIKEVSGGATSILGTLDACPCCGGKLSSEYFIAPFYWCAAEGKAFRVINGQIHYTPSITKEGGWHLNMSVKDIIIG